MGGRGGVQVGGEEGLGGVRLTPACEGVGNSAFFMSF